MSNNYHEDKKAKIERIANSDDCTKVSRILALSKLGCFESEIASKLNVKVRFVQYVLSQTRNNFR